MSIEELKQQRQGLKKTKKIQWPYAIILLLVVIVIYGLYFKQFKYGWVIFIGIIAGYVIQRSRFCFTASIRDVLLFKKTKVLQALILGMIVATIGFGLRQQQALLAGTAVPGQIAPVGIHTILGGILFGMGMVIAGGCVSGVFTRIGEGYLLQWITLIGLFIGTGFFMGTFSLWLKCCIEKSKTIYFGNYLPMPILILLQIIGLGLLFLCARKFGKKRK